MLFGPLEEDISAGQSYCVSLKVESGPKPWLRVDAGIFLLAGETDNAFLCRDYSNDLHLVMGERGLVYFPSESVLTMRVEIDETTVSIFFYIDGVIDHGDRLTLQWPGKFTRLAWALGTCVHENKAQIVANPRVLDDLPNESFVCLERDMSISTIADKVFFVSHQRFHNWLRQIKPFGPGEKFDIGEWKKGKPIRFTKGTHIPNPAFF